MKQFGIVLIIIGSLWAALAFSMETTLNTGSPYIGNIYIPDTAVNNIGLMDERRNHLMMASVLIIAGVILYGFGTIRQPYSNQAEQMPTALTRESATAEKYNLIYWITIAISIIFILFIIVKR